MSNITIDSNKTLLVEGKKTFPLLMFGVSNEWNTMTTSNYTVPELGLTSIQKLKNNFISFSNFNALSSTDISDYEQNAMYWIANPGQITPDKYNQNHYFGCLTWQEPDYKFYNCSNNDFTCELAKMKSVYNSIKASDPNHLVYLPLMGKVTTSSPSSFNYWKDCADVFTSDEWSYNDLYTDKTWGNYVFEYLMNDHLTWDINGNIDSLTKPAWIGIQAKGLISNQYVLTPLELRSAVYTVITMGARGLVFWGYKIWQDSAIQYGLVVNPTEFNIYDTQATEIKSLNDILVLPTESLRWMKYQSNNIVSLTGTYNTTINLWGSNVATDTNFNWLLKNDTVNGNKYLFILNKGAQTTTSIITISSVTNTTATTIGTLGIGNAASGRNINIVNGSFTDTFSPQTVHIYKIGNTTTCPPLIITIT